MENQNKPLSTNYNQSIKIEQEILSNGLQLFAHSTDNKDKTDWQPLFTHLSNVSRLSADYAKIFNGDEFAEIIGLLHDLGKATQAFQHRLEGSSIRVDHATWGAIKVCEKYPTWGTLMAYVIAGHHAGLTNGTTQKQTPNRPSLTLAERLQQKTNLPPLIEEFFKTLQPLLTATVKQPNLKTNPPQLSFQLMVYVRMLLSCLVDADRLDTEIFYLKAHQLPIIERGDYPTPQQIKQAVDAYLATFYPTTPIHHLRQQILTAVKNKANLPTGIFSLTVPTGGGKTLSSLSFAFDHICYHADKQQGLRRVIYAIPFTSIIEQNAQVFRQVLGQSLSHAVIEHHSAFNGSDVIDPDYPTEKTKLHQATENWDAPLIVTTTVQLMESLFSNRTTKLRKLHNIAGSVIILDEVQMLPLHLLLPCIEMLKELVANYGCSVVLCTATQPALIKREGFMHGFEQVVELAESETINPKQLYEDFQRVTVRYIGEHSDESLCERILEKKQALCIVNSRQQAQSLFKRLIEQTDHVYHLSTYMCAEHRTQILNQVRDRLKKGLPCWLISTSLIECGVDIDMPYVLRAEAGLDSIAQAAGRCNREGKSATSDSVVEIFQSTDHASPNQLKIYANKTREVLRQPMYEHEPLGLSAIWQYFNKLYFHLDKQLDQPDILANVKRCRFDSLPFAWVNDNFQVIKSAMTTVIVPFDEKAESTIEQIRALPDKMSVSALARQLQRYNIAMPNKMAENLCNQGELIYLQPQRFGKQFLVMRSLQPMYSDAMGFNPEQNPFALKFDEISW